MSWQIGLCVNGLEGRSGLQRSRSEISHIVFLGEVEWAYQSWATIVPQNSRKDPVESQERTRKESGSGWNALIVIGRCGRILGCLAYKRRAKWNLVESTICSPPTNLVQSDPGRCSSSTISKEGEVST